jgi:hypothetical protein
MSTHGFITRYLEEIEISAKPIVTRRCNSAETSRQKRSWIAPERGWHKVAIDGGLSRDGSKGAAATVCRTEHGQVLGASVNVLDGQNDPACLEAVACNEGLALAQDLNIGTVCLASDCLEMVTNYHKKALCPYSAILWEVEQRASHFRQVDVVHEKRETTVEAHILAKAASSLDAGRYVWLGSVPDICCIPLNVSVE